LSFVWVGHWCGAPGRVTHGFTDWADVRASVEPDPPRARGSLSAAHALRRRRYLPVTLDLARRAHHVPAVPSTSKRSSPPRVRSRRSRRSPVARAAGALLGVLAPPEPCSRRDLEPSPHDPPPRSRRSSRGARVPLGTTARRSGPPSALLSQLAPRARSRATLDAGWVSCGDDRNVPHDPSADTGSVTTRAVPEPPTAWFSGFVRAGSSDSHDLGHHEQARDSPRGHVPLWHEATVDRNRASETPQV